MVMGKLYLSTGTSTRRMIVLLAFLLLWAGKSPAEAQKININNFEFEDLFGKKNMKQTTDIAWTPDGRVLVATKGGIVKVYDENFKEKATALDVSKVLCTESERGLLSILVHPNFEDNNYIYVYYMHKGEGGNCDTDHAQNGPSSRLSRFILPNSNEINDSTEKVILETGPSGIMHNGGGMSFGNDGNIYLATGDSGYSRSLNSARKLNNLFGKVLRITDDGKIPKDNPYYSADNSPCNEKNTVKDAGNKECPEIFSVGLRNPFSLAMDPRKDKVRFLIGDVGAKTWEEINEGGHGFEEANYGWWNREGPCEHGQTAGNKCGVVDKSLTDPIHWYRNPDDDSGAITGGAFVPPGIWPDEWDGEFLYSDLKAGSLYHMKYTPSTFCRGNDCSDQTSAYTVVPLVDSFPGTLLRLKFGPHRDTRALYLIAYDTGMIYRLSYTGNMNRRPKPVIRKFLSSNGNGLTVNFDASKSSDPDGDDMTFEWNFGEDGSITSSNITTSYTYSTVGKFTATLSVTDMKGYKAKSFVDIDVEQYPKPLVAFPWSSGEACDDDHQSYDYCGSLEFCTDGDVHGYRLP
eukprot:scaffold60247_cov48-Attheya_sp.AAC.1